MDRITLGISGSSKRRPLHAVVQVSRCAAVLTFFSVQSTSFLDK